MAGFFRGKVDTFISRLMDVILSLPVLLLALGLVSACGLQPQGCLGGLIKPGLLLVSYVIGLFSWPYLARIVRGQVLSLREKEFVESARSMGAGNIRIMFKEILPNLIAPIIVYTTLLIPSNILFEAGVVVPRDRRADHDAVVGATALGREPHLRRGVVDDVLPGHVPAGYDPRLQPGRRRSAGRARSSGTAKARTGRRDGANGGGRRRQWPNRQSRTSPGPPSVKGTG